MWEMACIRASHSYAPATGSGFALSAQHSRLALVGTGHKTSEMFNPRMACIRARALIITGHELGRMTGMFAWGGGQRL